MTRALKSNGWRKSAFFLIIFNGLLAAIIYANAEVGEMLGVQGQPLAASVVWPPTGFSLAALLVYGINSWPGILVGNFIYNFLELYSFDTPFFAPFLTSLIVSLGSLFEAVFGYYIFKRCATKGFFQTVKDILIFLIPVGLLSAFLASLIGIIALAFYSEMSWKVASSLFLTFWIGDTMGIYVFTPLLAVWMLLRPVVPLGDYPWQGLFMVLAYLVITALTFVYNYPLAHFYIPLSIWVSYRFRMHGATVAIFFIALAFVVPTSLGMGPFQTAGSIPLGVLISFLEIIVAVSLILAALVNEREAAWRQIQDHNIDLQQAVELQEEELRVKTSERNYQEKRASFGLLALGVARQLQAPINKVNGFALVAIEILQKEREHLSALASTLDQGLFSSLQKCFRSLFSNLTDIIEYVAKAKEIALAVEEQTKLVAKEQIQIKSININTLLSKSLNETINVVGKMYPNFTFITKEEFDRAVTMILAVPEDLGRAFYYLIMSSVLSMKSKKDAQGMSYSPLLKISTVELHDRVEISIRDNGMGVSQEEAENYFFSFIEGMLAGKLEQEPPERLHLSLAYDIITHLYRGTIDIDSKQGDYFELVITIPKESYLTIS